TQQAQSFVTQVNQIILFPLITLLTAIAFLVFLWGCAEFIFGAANETTRAKGRQHIIWGIVGLVVMVAAYSILTIAAGTFGLGNQLNCANNASGPGCSTIFQIPNTGSTGSGGGGGTTGSTGSQP
ncbi:hypothetical protein KC887_03440, partial [Candidatus Kaiserbacteria bacterium]|nr:hypothetical protein [Candidatus Kaiserbacteria bacterium]